MLGVTKKHSRNDRKSIGKSTELSEDRSQKYWRGSQGKFSYREKQKRPVLSSDLNYISFGSGLCCLFIAFADYLLIKIFPVSTVEIFKDITDLLISFN